MTVLRESTTSGVWWNQCAVSWENIFWKIIDVRMHIERVEFLLSSTYICY